MSEPLVSIICPAYQAENYIEDCVNSVLEQTYQNWRLLIVDDGSTDLTNQRAANFAKLDSRVRVLRQPNKGPAAARQRAIDASTSELLAFLDSDDIWLPQKLELQVSFMSRTNCALSYTSFKRITANGLKVGALITPPAKLEYRDLLKNTGIATSTVMVNRGIAGAIRTSNVYYDDLALWLDILKAGHTAMCLNEDLMRYRVLEKSVSRNKIRSAVKVWEIYRNRQRLGLLECSWLFSHYAFNALKKYRTF